MKKFISIILVFCCLFLSACDFYTSNKTVNSSDIERIRICTSNGELINDFTIYKYEYNGHKYQLHVKGSGQSQVGGIIHDADCPCNKTN